MAVSEKMSAEKRALFETIMATVGSSADIQAKLDKVASLRGREEQLRVVMDDAAAAWKEVADEIKAIERETNSVVSKVQAMVDKVFAMRDGETVTRTRSSSSSPVRTSMPIPPEAFLYFRDDKEVEHNGRRLSVVLQPTDANPAQFDDLFKSVYGYGWRSSDMLEAIRNGAESWDIEVPGDKKPYTITIDLDGDYWDAYEWDTDEHDGEE